MKAVIYCRVSTEGQEEYGSSLESQRAACLCKAEELGYEVSPEDVFLETWSGATLERPLLNRIRELARLKLRNAVICYSTDRLARNPIHIAIIAEECEKKDVNLVFVSEPLDNSPEGQLIRYVKGFAAQIEREKIRERSLRGKREWCKKGKLATGGALPYGYRRETGQRVIYEPEANVVRTMFHWLAYEGYTLYRCAMRLKALGIAKRNGSAWLNTEIYRIVTNPAYKGETYAFRYMVVEPKNPKKELRRYPKTRHILRPEEEQIPIPNATPAIVDVETWERAQAQLKLNNQRSKRNRKRNYLLVGRFRCGACGRAIVGSIKKKGGREYGFYRCIRKINPALYGQCDSHIISQSKAERIVKEQVIRMVSNPELVLAGLREQSGSNSLAIFEADEVLLTSSLAQRKEELERYISLYGRGNIPFEILDRNVQKATKEIEELEAKLAELEGRKQEIHFSHAKLDNATKFLWNLSRKLDDPEIVKLALEALDIKVIMERDGAIKIDGLLPVHVEPSGQLVYANSSHW
jgi:site-specific DNA recombinase